MPLITYYCRVKTVTEVSVSVLYHVISVTMDDFQALIYRSTRPYSNHNYALWSGLLQKG